MSVRPHVQTIEMKEKVVVRHFLRDEDRVALYSQLPEFAMDQQIRWAEKTAHQILPYVQRGIVYHTAHDINHCVRVIENINRIVQIMNSNGASFSRAELRLLYISAWLHDIGNLRIDRRDDHARESCRMLRALLERNNFLDGAEWMQNCLESIILYHQSKNDLSRLVAEDYKVEGDRIRPRLLCAVFRLADACHMGPDRADGLVYFLIGDEFLEDAEDHWKANRAILSVDFELSERQIVITTSHAIEANILIEHFKREFDSVAGYLKEYIGVEGVQIHEITTQDLNIDEDEEVRPEFERLPSDDSQ